MLFSVSLYASLAIFLLGAIYRIWTWFTRNVGPPKEGFSAGRRLAAAFRGTLRAVFSRNLVRILKSFLLEALLQVRTLRRDRFRWVMHMLIWVGFILLLLMHALASLVTKEIFSGYESTLNPYLFLRNLFGAMVLAGAVLAWYRRATRKTVRSTTRFIDHGPLILLAVIMVSGFLLEGTKIISYPIFNQMVEDYSGVEDPEELEALKVYWAENYGVVFPRLEAKPDQETLAASREIHEWNCAGCHDRPQWAFLSYAGAKIMKPAALFLSEIRADVWLYYIHFLACFIGLAWLPFSKFFHIISSPLNLMVRSVLDPVRAEPANAATWRAMAFDACTHCGACSEHCSVEAVFTALRNRTILPSEKLTALKRLASNQGLSSQDLRNVQEGAFICSLCRRCTDVCPVGIDLQSLWEIIEEDLRAKGFPEPQVWAREVGASRAASAAAEPLQPDHQAMAALFSGGLSADGFSECFKCSTCTNVCPVTATWDEPARNLDLAPHQIMQALNLGLVDLALSARMLWDCTTCYLCQEHCPTGVPVTEIFFELKNAAYDRWKKVEGPAADRSGVGVEFQTLPRVGVKS